MLKTLRSSFSSPPPNALRIRCALTLSSTKAHEPSCALPLMRSLPSTVGEPVVVGTSVCKDDLGMVPLRPDRWPPTSATTSSEESSSQSPSVARIRNFSEEDDSGFDDPGLGRESFRWVTTGVAVTYGGVFDADGVGRMGLPVPATNALYNLHRSQD
jgi:hypothetical protein